MKDLKTPQAIRAFVRDATKVASIMSPTVPPGNTQVISLFVNTDSGHVRIWCREEDRTALALGLRNPETYVTIHWQVRGGRM